MSSYRIILHVHNKYVSGQCNSVTVDGEQSATHFWVAQTTLKLHTKQNNSSRHFSSPALPSLNYHSYLHLDSLPRCFSAHSESSSYRDQAWGTPQHAQRWSGRQHHRDQRAATESDAPILRYPSLLLQSAPHGPKHITLPACSGFWLYTRTSFDGVFCIHYRYISAQGAPRWVLSVRFLRSCIRTFQSSQCESMQRIVSICKEEHTVYFLLINCTDWVGRVWEHFSSK